MVTNLARYLEYQVKCRPEKYALSNGQNKLTFLQVYNASVNLADKIHEIAGNVRNCPIIVFAEKGLIEYISLMGVLCSGNYYVPLDIKMPRERLQKIISLLDAPLAISSKIQKEKLIASGFRGELLEVEELDFSKCKENWKQWIALITDICPAYVLFTSGSTGMPKGVVVSHRAVIDYMEWQCERIHFDDSFVLGNQAPFYFDASMPDLFTPLVCGAELNIIPEELFLIPNKLLEYIANNGINTLIWVPSALMLVTNKDYLEKKRIDGLKLVMFCGEIMPNKHLNLWRKQYPNVRFINLYGPTEAAYACSYYEVSREFANDEPLPIGKACENTEIIVLDEENQLVSQKEKEGELCIKGSCLASGYFRNPEKTSEFFIQNPLNKDYVELIYRTGDIVKYNSFGELEYVGRKDFQIKHMGYRIELGEIENAAYGIDGVKQCCAVYSKVQEKIVLFCSVENDLTDKSIYKFLKNKIPKYMLPKEIVLKENLPLNANGKINRLELQKEIGGE